MKKMTAFTLVELLVVIAIISILASLLLPVIENALEQSRRISCANTQKQTYLGCENYMQENNEWMPYFGEGFYPAAGNASGAYPAYWFSLWPLEIRYCPTMLRSPSSGGPGGHPVVNSIAWFNRLEFGYCMLLNNTFHRDTAYDSTGYYFRPRVDTWGMALNATTGQIERYAFYGRYWKHLGTDPMLACPIIIGTSTSRYTTPHAGGDARTTYARQPAGANSAWDDGHVEWHGWGNSDFAVDRRARYTGYGAVQPEGWTASGSLWFWGKRSRSIQ